MKMQLLLAFVTVTLMAASAQAQNMLPNAGFEEGTFSTDPGTFPDGWAGWPEADGTIVWVDDAAGAHSGSKYMTMTNPQNQDRWLWSDMIPVTEGTEYIASLWARTLTQGEPAKTLLNITWYNAADASVGGGWIGGPDVGDDWAQATFDPLVAPAGAVKLDINFIGCRYHGNVTGYLDTLGVAYDDVSLTPEPATMALLALGGLALLRRRRRS